MNSGISSDNLLDQKKYAEAEPFARECLAIRAKNKPDGWTTFFTRFMVGTSLVGQKKYADAEPFLIAGIRRHERARGQDAGRRQGRAHESRRTARRTL